jgi:K+-transporting ATPase ATPase C chain
MFREVLTSLRLFLASVVVCCVLYPLAILAFATVAAPEKRLGTLVYDGEGQAVGSRLVSQAFSRPEYFWPRPSAANYDASAAAGSNLSPSNPLLRERAEEILTRLALPEGQPAPADLVTASGSGLDPHISLEAALVQVPRVAASRDVSENELRRLIDEHREGAMPSVAGEGPLVNVLLLNLALDRAHSMPAPAP